VRPQSPILLVQKGEALILQHRVRLLPAGGRVLDVELGELGVEVAGVGGVASAERDEGGARLHTTAVTSHHITSRHSTPQPLHHITSHHITTQHMRESSRKKKMKKKKEEKYEAEERTEEMKREYIRCVREVTPSNRHVPQK
jgi:hypothetical protein